MKNIVCIFAHPDDEAFGPGGTIALLAQKYSVRIVCVTNGEAGINSTKETRALSEIRRDELLKSAEVLGVKDVQFVGYKDGSLSNNLYHEITDKLINILDAFKPDTLLTFEPRGVSGHLDHITVSMVTSFIFEKLSYVKKIMYYCISEDNRALEGDYFIYFPPGYTRQEIHEVFDVSPVWNIKLAAMIEHRSQKHDADRIMKKLNKLPREEYFLVRKKQDK